MGGSVTQTALQSFKPLFALNYSATHAREHNMVYVLDALDAYNKRLVKKIAVKGFEVKNFRGTDKYLYMEGILLDSRKPPRARLELEVAHGNGIKRNSTSLARATASILPPMRWNSTGTWPSPASTPSPERWRSPAARSFRKGDVVGDVSEQDMRRVQIRETILSHLEKEAQNFRLGVKTLSLFFIDEVARYRQYDEDGNELPGEYGRIFEEEYLSVLAEYRNFLDPSICNTSMAFLPMRPTGAISASTRRPGAPLTAHPSAAASSPTIFPPTT